MTTLGYDFLKTHQNTIPPSSDYDVINRTSRATTKCKLIISDQGAREVIDAMKDETTAIKTTAKGQIAIIEETKKSSLIDAMNTKSANIDKSKTQLFNNIDEALENYRSMAIEIIKSNAYQELSALTLLKELIKELKIVGFSDTAPLINQINNNFKELGIPIVSSTTNNQSGGISYIKYTGGADIPQVNALEKELTEETKIKITTKSDINQNITGEKTIQFSDKQKELVQKISSLQYILKEDQRNELKKKYSISLPESEQKMVLKNIDNFADINDIVTKVKEVDASTKTLSNYAANDVINQRIINSIEINNKKIHEEIKTISKLMNDRTSRFSDVQLSINNEFDRMVDKSKEIISRNSAQVYSYNSRTTDKIKEAYYKIESLVINSTNIFKSDADKITKIYIDEKTSVLHVYEQSLNDIQGKQTFELDNLTVEFNKQNEIMCKYFEHDNFLSSKGSYVNATILAIRIEKPFFGKKKNVIDIQIDKKPYGHVIPIDNVNFCVEKNLIF